MDCGLVHKVQRVTKPGLPLKAYEDLKAFKLFVLDVGLLSCKEFKGALTEQYVLQQLKTLHGIETYYWTNERGGVEIDFLVDNESNIFPIEVKAESNLKAKSLRIYYEKFSPKISIRTAMTDYKQEDWLINLPLWAINTLQINL